MLHGTSYALENLTHCVGQGFQEYGVVCQGVACVCVCGWGRRTTKGRRKLTTMARFAWLHHRARSVTHARYSRDTERWHPDFHVVIHHGASPDTRSHKYVASRNHDHSC